MIPNCEKSKPFITLNFLQQQQQFQIVLMLLHLKKRINKAYSPQISEQNQQLSLYSPLQQWVEVHSSTSLKDVVEIETVPQPLYMNSSSQGLSFQSEYDLWTLQHQEFDLVSYSRKYSSQHSIITPTKTFKNHLINLTNTGILNLWSSDKIDNNKKSKEPNNPQSFGQISVKESQQSQEIDSEGVQTWLQTESMHKQYKNGFSLANLAVNQQGFYTLHNVDYNNGMIKTKINSTELTDSQSQSHFFRCTMPANISTIQAWNNSILAYGGAELLLLDRRSQAIVAQLNELEDSSVNFVKRKPDNGNQVFVCRDSYVLVMDLRKSGQIVAVTMEGGQDIEAMTTIKEVSQEYYCLTSKYTGNIGFYEIQS